MTQPFITINKFDNKNTFLYPQESDNTILFPLFALALFTLFVGAIGIPFNQERMDFDILSKWLSLATNIITFIFSKPFT
ncbi:hypothetical protein VitviT2T_025871 [Vitis vinifera]|uniref:NAD(P)H-quinone oxidoreductase subunit 5, chloroplastic n=1 Tax=Vitis vinifera TaxID=29760 RepID=A0ABY9DK73_VITVI|nr:hypothetical protein VitviT2T_025871 [Vitis vinifera]